MLPTDAKLDSSWEREGKRISGQPDLGLVFPLGNTSLCLVNCQLREEVKTDELNHVFASTRFWNPIVTNEDCEMILESTHSLSSFWPDNLSQEERKKNGKKASTFLKVTQYSSPIYKSLIKFFLAKQMYLRTCRQCKGSGGTKMPPPSVSNLAFMFCLVCVLFYVLI